MPPMPIPGTEPDHFTLNVSGIAGFLGGEEAVSAMESVHFYKYRKYLGLYNTPGSYTVAKHYGKLANSQLWDGLYPGINDEPAKFLKMDGERGPKYIGTISGTTIDDIGHIGYIFGQMCRRDLHEDPTNTVKPKRKTGAPTRVTIVELEGESHGGEKEITIPYPATFLSTPLRHIIAIATIMFSIGACLVCGIFEEWYAFALILLGILCNGFACFEIGSAKIFLTRPTPSEHSPSGHGVMDDRDQLIVLRGNQAAVNYITSGRFIVRYGHRNDGKYHRLGLSATALTFQFIAQLFLIPQSGLFGQILFLSTLAVSWVNNACFSSIDKEALQKKILKQNFPLQETFGTKYSLPTRTTAVVFAMLQALPLEELREKTQTRREAHIRNILESLLPTGTEDWSYWMDVVSKKVAQMVDVPVHGWEKSPFQNQDRRGSKLLDHLFGDADLAVDEFCRLGYQKS
ncbi:hypothetical protein ONZ45_g12872 [Pleurotus djamor]|nr:hypothetical protein ONZ45_g12872 [Pleurotus djamor]